MASMSPFALISICYMIISNVFAVISEDGLSSTITDCYNDIAQTMTDKDGDCQSEMNDISTLIDDTFEYCGYFTYNAEQQCVDRDEYLKMMTNTTEFCGTYDAVAFYLDFQETNTDELYQTLAVAEYTKAKGDNCVNALNEQVSVHYDLNGLVHTVTETKDFENRICHQYTNLLKINSDQYFADQEEIMGTGFGLVAAPVYIDDSRAGVIVLDDEIRELESGWDVNSKPNSPQIIEAWKQWGITYKCKVGYPEESSFIYIQFESN